MNWRTPGYVVREKLQREKLRIRAGSRAWGFEERLVERRESELARKYWEEIKGRIKRRRKLSEWERKRRKFV